LGVAFSLSIPSSSNLFKSSMLSGSERVMN